VRESINPAVAGGIIAALVLVVGLVIWKVAGSTGQANAKPPSMPPKVQAEWNKYAQQGGTGGAKSPEGMPIGPGAGTDPGGPARPFPSGN
jgi:hypothetical protein